MQRLIRCTYLLITALILGASLAQAQTLNAQAKNTNNATTKREFKGADLLAQARLQMRPRFNLMPESRAVTTSRPLFTITPSASGPNLPVQGSGTVGRITKWTGLTSGNSFIGDTTIFETKTGSVGIGTDTPTSKLTVAGMIQTTLGGYKFPDGTVQTTAAVSTVGLQMVSHDATLTGNGTAAMPLGVAIPLSLSGSLANPASIITATNTSSGAGVQGISSSGTGVIGTGTVTGNGVSGTSLEGSGVVGSTSSSSSNAAGVAGISSGAAGDGIAGRFSGDVSIVSSGTQPGNLSVAGMLSKGGGTFKIDHPLDPEKKYLYHSFVESPDMMNIYNGNITTDERGEALITLPAYFEALNRDFRYQLTVIGTFAQAIVAEKVKGNRFVIKTNSPNVEVSWQVTGIRQDAFANQNRVQVEVEKEVKERGYYLHPEVLGQPEERGIEWARNPELMQQLKQRRIDAEQTRKQKANDR